MAATNKSRESEVVLRFRFFKVFEDGQIEPKWPIRKITPPSLDPTTGVQSKDVVISTSPQISARIFSPPGPGPNKKLPLLYYIHGGSFCMQSAFSPMYTRYLISLVAQAKIIAVSIGYRLYQESPIPACYEDAWAGLQWVVAHADGTGPDRLLNTHVDFRQLFVSGDSGGANIAHFVAVQVGLFGLPFKARINGLILVHPFFGGTDHDDDRMWLYLCPTNRGPNDPRLRPSREDLAKLGCDRVLVFQAERDHLGVVAEEYCQELKKSGWKGSIELVVNKGRTHGFHLNKMNDVESSLIQNRICMFINHIQAHSSL